MEAKLWYGPVMASAEPRRLPLHFHGASSEHRDSWIRTRPLCCGVAHGSMEDIQQRPEWGKGKAFHREHGTGGVLAACLCLPLCGHQEQVNGLREWMVYSRTGPLRDHCTLMQMCKLESTAVLAAGLQEDSAWWPKLATWSRGNLFSATPCRSEERGR